MTGIAKHSFFGSFDEVDECNIQNVIYKPARKPEIINNVVFKRKRNDKRGEEDVSCSLFEIFSI